MLPFNSEKVNKNTDFYNKKILTYARRFWSNKVGGEETLNHIPRPQRLAFVFLEIKKNSDRVTKVKRPGRKERLSQAGSGELRQVADNRRRAHEEPWG
jgi:hypothetical protein